MNVVNVVSHPLRSLDGVQLMGSPKTKIGIIVSEHPLEHAAAEAGRNLVTALNEGGVQAELHTVPLESSYFFHLMPLFRAFTEGEVNEPTLKANLQGQTWTREALMWIQRITQENPGTEFFRMHNYVARLDKSTTPYSLAWVPEELKGRWTKLTELRVGTYEDGSHIDEQFQRLCSTVSSGMPLTPEEDALMSGHIIVARKGDTLRYQEGDRKALQPVPEAELPEHYIPARIIELPAIVTNFLGRGIPDGALDDDRLRGHPLLLAPEELALTELGVGTGITDPELKMMLLKHYNNRWALLDKNINRKLGLTGGYIVKPLAEHIIQELQGKNTV